MGPSNSLNIYREYKTYLLWYKWDSDLYQECFF